MKSPSELIGTPYTRHESPIPQSSAAPKLPIVFAHVHDARQRERLALRAPLERDDADDQEERG